MSVLSVLLYPFSVLFRVATDIRNHLYSIGHKKSTKFEVPVVVVGNLNVGGSGKTPAIEYLIRLLKNDFKLATLSRGYGRRTRGLRFASEKDTAASLGDEPYQFFKNYGSEVKVVVGEDRAFAIPNILHEWSDVNVILLDDAFQHRRVTPHLSILLTEFDRPFFTDHLIPSGRLRESRKEASRADIIIVTKCREELSESDEKKLVQRICDYAGDKPVFFSQIEYGQPQPFINNHKIGNDVVLVSGIANARPLEKHVGDNFKLLRHFKFRDHHHYSVKEVQSIADFIRNNPGASLLTTEKDMVRLLDPRFQSILKDVPSFYFPIKMTFMKNGSDFDAIVRKAIEKVIANANSAID
ncbi:MAG: tetraacyldisaccharide 4'-kinase [Cyclobacteriaceae bacterium]